MCDDVNENDLHEILPFSVLGRTKTQLINSSLITPKFYTTIVDYELNDGFVSYVIECGIIMSGFINVEVNRFRTRYSQLLQLYEKAKEMNPSL